MGDHEYPTAYFEKGQRVNLADLTECETDVHEFGPGTYALVSVPEGFRLIERTCDTCKGSGLTAFEGMTRPQRTCTSCHGAGSVPVLQRECPNCDGRLCMDCVLRHVHDECNYESCPECNGDGWVDVKEGD